MNNKELKMGLKKELLKLLDTIVTVKHKDYKLGFAGKCERVNRRTRGRLVNFTMDEQYGLILVLDSKDGIVCISDAFAIGNKWGFNYFSLYKRHYAKRNAGLLNLLINTTGDDKLSWNKL